MQTYYGHLSRIASGAYAGKQIQQGDLVGYVGSTGLSSGPHLHYEMRQNSRPINPACLKMEAGDPVPPSRMADFQRVVAAADQAFASAIFRNVKDAESRKNAHSLALRTEDFPSLN
jgi:hypothetical protein